MRTEHISISLNANNLLPKIDKSVLHDYVIRNRSMDLMLARKRAQKHIKDLHPEVIAYLALIDGAMHWPDGKPVDLTPSFTAMNDGR